MATGSNFQLNGRSVSLSGAEPMESLLRWLRRRQLTGTKEGCADGDCGACTVALLDRDAEGHPCYRAVNSCLLPVGLLPGRQLVTVEGLADGERLHPVQQALVDSSGSQCGYCTPGFVMSLFAGYYSGELGDDAIEGNLCRCTGYLPIRAAAVRLREERRSGDRFDAELANAKGAPVAAALGGCFSPGSVEEALRLKQHLPAAAWIAGATDLGVTASHGLAMAPQLIALDRIDALKHIEIGEHEVRIGAGASLSALQSRLGGVYPALDTMLGWFAGRQIRNRATLGGNLGTASPIGDLPPVLLALDATVHCEGPAGARAIAIADFFLGYRKSALAADELITAVSLLRPGPTCSAAYKIAKRQTDDISIVAAVFALGFDGERRVSHARLAYGGVAATPRRALAGERALIGQRLEPDVVDRVAAALESEFTPISDHRAGAGYRRALTGTLFRKFIAEHCR